MQEKSATGCNKQRKAVVKSRLKSAFWTRLTIPYKSGWARLIRKVYATDPLECRKFKAPMRVIALIADRAVIRHILEHLGLWAPRAMQRSPQLGTEA